MVRVEWGGEVGGKRSREGEQPTIAKRGVSNNQEEVRVA
jgi:hypothetical protein